MLWRSQLMLWRSMYWAFPVTGRSQGLAAAPGHGQVALGTNKVALDLGGPVWGPRATLLVHSATWPWPGAAARPWDIREGALDIRESSLDSRERPLDSRERPFDIRKRRGGVGWGGVGWGGVGWGGVGWGGVGWGGVGWGGVGWGGVAVNICRRVCQHVGASKHFSRKVEQ